MSIQNYLCPSTLNEALEALKEGKGTARCIAGATDMFLDLEKKTKAAETLVDIRRIPELRGIRKEGNRLFIGAAMTHTEVENDPLVKEYFPALAKGASVVGGPQIRNIGTIGGNVLNAQPAADTAVPLFAYGAKAVIVHADGTEEESELAPLYAGPGKTAVDCTSCILKGFYLDLDAFNVSGFDRQAKRNSLCLPMLNMAAALKLEGGKIVACGLCCGPMAKTPLRLTDAEALLLGKAPSKELFEEAGKLVENQASPRDSMLRGGSEFRKELLGVMMKNLLLAICSMQ